jgi:hypothetical protein
MPPILYNNTPTEHAIMHNTCLSLCSHFNGQTMITEKPESIHNLYYWLTVTEGVGTSK